MNPTERRQKILDVLCQRRHDTYDNLAHEFGVSKRTICSDIGILMCTYPLETVRGRYGGGIKVMDGYYHDYRPRKSLTTKQTALLKKLSEQLTDDELDTINSIIVQFAP